jgi:REP element-mobilizing transposase RayT
MAFSDYKELLRKPMLEELDEHIGRASGGNIDKTGVFYHVITRTQGGENHFLTKGSGDYRHTMMCNLCEERGITIIFSVTMPNHTHEVFLTPSWEKLSDMIRTLNTNLSKYIRSHTTARIGEKEKIFRRYPIYIPIRDIVYLMTCGKYIYDNPNYLKEGKRYIPSETFWMFKTGHMLTGYDERIYQRLFGLTPAQIYELFSTKSKDQVIAYAKKQYAFWTPEMTHGVFYKKE